MNCLEFDLNLKVAELFRDEFFRFIVNFICFNRQFNARGKKEGMDLVKSLEQVL